MNLENLKEQEEAERLDWAAKTRAALAAGPLITHDLITAAGMAGWRGRNRYVGWLRRFAEIRSIGKQSGPTGHENHVWELVK